MINICLYEDDGYQALQPLTFMRPVYALRVGADTLYDKVFYHFGYGNITLHCRPGLKPYVRRAFPKHIVNDINTGAPCLLINGRLVVSSILYRIFDENQGQYNVIYTHRGHVVAMYLQGKALEYIKAKLESGVLNSQATIAHLRAQCVAKELDDIGLITYPWDLVTHNQAILVADFERFSLGGIVKGDMAPYSMIYNENDVYVGKRSKIEDFVLIDARKGPVFIDEDVIVQSGSRLEGPVYIGVGTHVLGASIKASSIGAHCRVGGEVSQSIMHDFSNKAHYGYVGNSVIGSWVNLGAGTTTSNLKNTYGTIKVTINGQSLDSGSQFIGAFIGDHSKLAIGTLLSAGTVVGFGSALMGTAVHQRVIAPFSWGSVAEYKVYQLDKFLEVADRMMSRRDVEMTLDERELMVSLFTQQATPSTSV